MRLILAAAAGRRTAARPAAVSLSSLSLGAYDLPPARDTVTVRCETSLAAGSLPMSLRGGIMIRATPDLV